MDSQQLAAHPLSGDEHHHLAGSHTNVHYQGDQGTEKKSVLKKVKAKAKKIKDTIKKHGHLHSHEHGDQGQDQQQYDAHTHPEYDEDDDDEDDDEEMEHDPEVHGAPIYESETARNPVIGLEGNQGLHHQTKLEKTHEAKVGKDHNRDDVPLSYGHTTMPEVIGGGRTIGRLILPEDAPVAPRKTPISSHGEDHGHGQAAAQEQGAIGKKLTGLEEDLCAPKHTSGKPCQPGNYQAKVTETTGAGAEETRGITPLIHSLDKMAVSKDQKASTGSHDQFKLEAEHDHPQKYRDMPDESPLMKDSLPEQDRVPQSSYTDKLAFATAAIADKAASAKDAMASKLGYGSSEGTHTKLEQGSHTDKVSQVAHVSEDAHTQPEQASYTEKASHVASLLADKAVAAKNIVASKLTGGTEEAEGTTGTQMLQREHEALGTEQPKQSSYSEKISGATAVLADKAVGAKNVVASKLGYGQEGATAGHSNPNTDQGRTITEQPKQSSYPEKLSGATAVLADKAVGAKNVVASKLGYGQEDATARHSNPNLNEESVTSTIAAQPKQSSYTEKLSGATAVLADKAVGAKNVVASKLGYGQEGDTSSHTNPNKNQGSVTSTIADKAVQAKNVVASKLGYGTEGTDSTKGPNGTWSEKLKPGEEEKVLSEFISGALYKKKNAEEGGVNVNEHGTVKEVVSDTVHKQQAEHEVKKPMGKVTESEEVARRLGTSEEEKRGEVTHVPGSESPRKVAVINTIKETVSSWWSPGDQTQQSDTIHTGTEERRLQEN